MQIGILEWVCGGGLQATPTAEIAKSLLTEGWAMLNAVAQDFGRCGHDVIANIDARFFDGPQLSGFKSGFRRSSKSGFTKGLPSGWWEIASQADAVIVIAPEFSRILQTAILQLAPVCKLLLNCQGEFLTASCDKWITAQRLQASDVLHPATQLACAATEDWLNQNATASRRWILKPRDGAGCEAIQLHHESTLREALETTRAKDSNSGMILQPFHSGAAFSRSAIIDTSGRAHWLPLVTQEFLAGDALTYTGGRVLVESDLQCADLRAGAQFSIAKLDAVLKATIEALGQGACGWVGVDLLYSDELDDWMVIEVNPRLTTSFTGLSMSYGPGLMQHMLQAGQGLEVAIGTTWKAISFNAAGGLL